MTSNDDGDDEILPSQIPLLDDVVEPGQKKPVRRKRQKENYALDLNPDPPRTRDLFSGEVEPIHPDVRPDQPAEGLPAVEANKPAQGSEENPDDIDIYMDLVGIPEEELRAHADQVVENLVREYSSEILRRLRDELSSLLDDLDTDDDANL